MRFSRFSASLLLPLFFAFVPAPAPALAANTVLTDYVLRLPNALIDQLAPAAAPAGGKENFPLADQALEAAGAKISLQAIQAGLDYQLATPEAAGEHAWHVKTSRLAAQLRVGRLLILRREVNEKDGVVLDHEQRIECRDLTLRLRGEAGAGVEGIVRAALMDGEMQLTLQEYRGHWPAGAWAVESLDCPAVAGIGGAVATQILELLARTSLLDAQVRPALEKALLAAGKQAGTGLSGAFNLPVGIDGVRIQAEGGAVREIPGGFEMRGKLRMEVKKGSGNRELALGPVAAAPIGASPQLILPQEALDAFLEAGFQAGLLRHEVRSRELSGFRALTRSRFKQFFAWPDLRRFPKDTNFLFRLSPQTAPRLANTSSPRAGVVSGELDLPLSIRMFAPIERRWHPYVEFRTRIHGPASLRVSGGALKIRLRAGEEELTHEFSREYVDRYRPNTRISTRRLRDSLVEAINGEEFSLPLPALKVGGVELKPSAIGLLGAGRAQALQLQFSRR